MNLLLKVDNIIAIRKDIQDIIYEYCSVVIGDFDKIIEIVSDFKFVRVNLYDINNKILFGELTFSPACCVFSYS